MKRLMTSLIAFGLVVGAASPALAFGSLGVRIGTGTSFVDADETSGAEPEVMPFAVGPALLIGLPFVALEIDALYWRNTTTIKSNGVEVNATDDHLAVPIIGKVSLPIPLPIISFEIGAGLEPRFLLAEPKNAEGYNSYVMYLPIVAGAHFDLSVIEAGLELRYEHQLTETYENQGDDRVHQLMVFGGVFF